MAELEVAHHVPGRIRLKLLVLKRNHDLCRHVESSLGAIDGIQRVEANPLTGSVIIEYRPAQDPPPEFVTRLADALSSVIPHLDADDLQAVFGQGVRLARSASELPEARRSLAGGLVDFWRRLQGKISEEFRLTADENGRIALDVRVTSPVDGRVLRYHIQTDDHARGRTHATTLSIQAADDDAGALEIGPVEITDGDETAGPVDFTLQRGVEYLIRFSSAGFDPHEEVSGRVGADIRRGG